MPWGLHCTALKEKNCDNDISESVRHRLLDVNTNLREVHVKKPKEGGEKMAEE